jgi:hypothetical protein
MRVGESLSDYVTIIYNRCPIKSASNACEIFYKKSFAKFCHFIYAKDVTKASVNLASKPRQRKNNFGC